MRCKWKIDNTTWRIVQKILSSPNRTNRSNKKASTRVPEYREIFLNVANEMQIEEIGRIELLFFSDRIQLTVLDVDESMQPLHSLCKFLQPLNRRVIVCKSLHITLLASGQIIFKILHVRQSHIFLISSKQRLKNPNYRVLFSR